MPVQTGFRTGRQLAERYTANRARLGEPLDVIKFVCKEFWMEVFRKQARPAPAPHRQHCRAWKAVAAQGKPHHPFNLWLLALICVSCHSGRICS